MNVLGVDMMNVLEIVLINIGIVGVGAAIGWAIGFMK